MRIHTDHLTPADVRAAVRSASDRTGAVVFIERESRHGSRSHRAAWEIQLSSDGTLSRRRNMSNTAYAATWDQWGWFLDHLFSVDPGMVVGSVGSPIYAGREDFHRKTAHVTGQAAGWVGAL